MTTNFEGTVLNANRGYGISSGLVDEYGKRLATDATVVESCDGGDNKWPVIEDELKSTYRNIRYVFQVGKKDCNNAIDGHLYNPQHGAIDDGWKRGLYELPPGIAIMGISLVPLIYADGVTVQFTVMDIDGNAVLTSRVLDLAPTTDCATQFTDDIIDPPVILNTKHYLMVEVVTTTDGTNPTDCALTQYAVSTSLQIKDYCHVSPAGLECEFTPDNTTPTNTVATV